MASRKTSVTASAKTSKRKVEKKLKVYKVDCPQAKGVGPCIARALMSTQIHEALASTVWHHRDDSLKMTEFVVGDIEAIPLAGKKGHFTYGVVVNSLTKEVYDSSMEMTLQKFFQTFVPAREIEAHDYSS